MTLFPAGLPTMVDAMEIVLRHAEVSDEYVRSEQFYGYYIKWASESLSMAWDGSDEQS